MNGLVWVASRHLRLLDTSAAIKTDDETAAAGIDALLAPFVVGDGDADDCDCYALVDGDHVGIEQRRGKRVAYRNGKVLGVGDTWALPLTALLSNLNRRVIDGYGGIAVHAAVVAIGGVAIAMPATAGGGKSTLAAACLQAGFGYVSDEALCIDLATKAVVPYPKPIGLSAWSRHRLGIADESLPFPAGSAEGMAAPSGLGAAVVDRPLPLGHVVLTEIGESEATLDQAAGHEAMAALIRLSFNHYKHGKQGFELVSGLVDRAGVWRLRYGDPADAAALLRERLGVTSST